MKNIIFIIGFLLTSNFLFSQEQLTSAESNCDLSNVFINFNYVADGCEVLFGSYLANLPKNCNGEYSYSFGDGSPASPGHTLDPTCAANQYNGNGTYVACITYTVDKFNSISKCINVIVSECDTGGCCNLSISPPTISASFLNMVLFGGGGTSSNGNCTNLTKEYDYGDGTSGTSIVHAYDSPGAYTVCITATVTSPDNIICSETACNTINIGLKADDNPSKLYDIIEVSNRIKNTTIVTNDNLKIYPNPVKNYLNVDFNLDYNEVSGLISLIDLQGKTLYFEKLDESNYSISINVSNLPIGLYLIKFKSTKGNLMYKKINKI